MLRFQLIFFQHLLDLFPFIKHQHIYNGKTGDEGIAELGIFDGLHFDEIELDSCILEICLMVQLPSAGSVDVGVSAQALADVDDFVFAG